MPTLKKLTCSVEWSGLGIHLQEHNTSYADGFVKTYIAVPSMPTPFSIRLRSDGYIAPGLAMFVYMDGVYQCNRNRHNLKIPDGTSTRKQTEIDFHVRQKEEMMWDGTFRAKQWRFQKLDVVYNPSELKNSHVPHDAEYVGTIEVVVLRCLGPEASNADISQHQIPESTFAAQALNPSKSKWSNPKITMLQSSDDDSWSGSSSASAVAGMFDGACDYATNPTGSMAFGGDMAWDNPLPNQDQSQQWRSSSRGPDRSPSGGPGPNTGKGGYQHSGARDRSQDRYSQDWGPARSESKRSHNSPNSQGNAEQNSNNAKSKTVSSVVPRHSPASSAVGRNGPNDPAADAPAVVININRGPRPRREPTWTEASEVDSVNENVPWHNYGQDDKHNQFQHREKRSPNGSVDHEGSKKSNYAEGSWQAQPAYDGKGGDRGYSRPENWETAEPAIPGGWDASNDQHQANNANWDNNQSNNSTTWKATNERSQNNDNNWNNENNNSGWDVQGNNSADTWDNANTQGRGVNNEWNAKDNGSAPGWDSSAAQNQGENQQWNPDENNNAAQNNWTGGSGWNDRASSQQNNNSPSNNRDLAAQSWGGKDENNNWAGPIQPDSGETGAASDFGNVQSKSRFSGVESQEKSHSPFRFMNDPSQVDKPSSPHPSRKQSSPQAAWVESGATVPGMAPQQSPPQLPTHDGPNAPRIGSFGSVQPGLSDSDAFRPKPYWSSWKQPEENNNRPNPFAPAFASVKPLCKVPSEVAQRNSTTHQVHVGQSIRYVHRKASPKYMDGHDDPYAVFVFKYRSRATLEQMLNTKLTETEAEGRLRMQGMSKDDLIEQILKVKANTTSQDSSGSESSSTSNNSGGSKNTLKGNNTAYNSNRQADGAPLGAVNQQLSQLQMHSNQHPDVRWGRDTQGVQNDSHERVTGWLGSDHGGGVGVLEGEGGGNGNWNNDNNTGSQYNTNQNVGGGGGGSQW